MIDMILQFFFQKDAITDLSLFFACTILGIFSALIPRTQDKMLGKTYGREKSIRVLVKSALTLLWFLSSILFLFRAVIVGIGSLSFWALLLYIIAFCINLSIVLFLNSKVDKRWHGFHRKEIDSILNDNPIYKKCINECDNNAYKAIYILDDKIIISNEQVFFDDMNCTTETLYIPVDSNKEALQKAEMMAKDWKKKTIDSLSTKGSCIQFSAYGYDLISDESMSQLSEALADKLALKSYAIKKTYRVIHTEASSILLGGKGETLSATTIGGKSYEAQFTATAATILYKPLTQTTPEKLTKW